MLLLIVVLLLSTAVHAQAPGPNPAELEAMKNLDYIVGRWEGESWILRPSGERFTSRGGETVQWKLSGKILLIEGLFKSTGPDGQEFVSHETLGVISYDPREGTYNFRTYVARGSVGDHKITLLGEHGWQWSLAGSAGSTVRFTIQVTEDGKWHEIGERSTDGKNWQKFFEMTLSRVD